MADRSPTVRMMALCDLAQRETPPTAVLDSVMKLVRDPDLDVRSEAARVLALNGEAAQAAVPDLIQCLWTRVPELRRQAAAALSVVGGPPVQVVPDLIRLLDDPDPSVADAAVAALFPLASHASEAVPALVEALRLKEIRCHSSDVVADTLVAIDPPGEVLERLLMPMESEVRESAMRSIRSAQYRAWERYLPAAQADEEAEEVIE